MRRTTSAAITVLSLIGGVCGSSASAQCPIVLNLDGGADSYVYALADFNGSLIAGGDFDSIGGVAVNSLALWDGEHWQSIGGNFNAVRNLTVFQNQLVVASGGNNFGRYNGSQWQMHTAPSGGIKAFTECNNEFIIGGQFFHQSNFINVLRWNFDTNQWQTMGPPGTFGTYSVKTLTVYNGKLIAGGDFFVLNDKPVSGLAWWDEATQTWQPFTPGLNHNGQVYSLAVYEDDLIVAGAFVHAGEIYSRGVARWNDKTGWQSMAGGVSQHVNAVTVHDGDLIIGGYFTTAGSQPVNNIARWNPSAEDWEAIGNGVTNCCGYGASVYTIAASGGRLFAGGWFGFGQENASQYVIAWEDCVIACNADITSDTVVNVADLLAVISAWGPCAAPPAACVADVNDDLQVNVSDLLAVISAWGPCPSN